MGKNQSSEYVGLRLRLWAFLVDLLVFVFFSVPFLYLIHGREYFKSAISVRGPVDLINTLVFPSLAILLFWLAWSATPGKMVVSAKIVDVKSGQKPTAKQFLLRFAGYFLALLPLGFGILWIAFDPRKQGWHDKLAGTAVVRAKR